MSSERLARFLVCVVIVAGAWGLLGHMQSGLSAVRENLLVRTRFLVRQAHGGDPERLTRLAGRYCLPGSGAAQRKAKFQRMLVVLRDCEPGSVAYAGGSAAVNESTGSNRQIVLRGKDERGRPAPVLLDWVRVDGAWYVQSCKVKRIASAPSRKKRSPLLSNAAPGGKERSTGVRNPHREKQAVSPRRWSPRGEEQYHGHSSGVGGNGPGAGHAGGAAPNIPGRWVPAGEERTAS